MGRGDVSAVLIVKDEEAVIGRCLASLQGLDQVVLYDTGSKDRTMDIARSMGADVFWTYGSDPFHFAEARNSATMHARNRWVLSIDADEVLLEGSIGAIRKAVAGSALATAYRISYVNWDPSHTFSIRRPRKRVFRKDLYKWRWRIHEGLLPKRPELVKEAPECVLEHLPIPPKDGRRSQNIALLELCVRESPEHLDALQQLGFEYHLRGNYTAAIPHLESFILRGAKKGPLQRCSALLILGECRARSGLVKEACDAFMQAHREAPDLREPFWWAAKELIRAGQPWNAIWWLDEGLKIKPHDRPGFSHNLTEIHETPAFEDTLAECRAMVSDLERAWRERNPGAPLQAP